MQKSELSPLLKQNLHAQFKKKEEEKKKTNTLKKTMNHTPSDPSMLPSELFPVPMNLPLPDLI